MNKILITSLTTATKSILDASTRAELEQVSVDASTELIPKSEGQYFIWLKERLKKQYSSSPTIASLSFVRSSDLKKLLLNESVATFSRKAIDKKLHALPHDINSVTKVPLIYKKQYLGFIIIYSKVEAEKITEEMREALRILTNTVAIAFTKMQIQDESKKALEIRDRFISIASHELRTPLTSLHGYIQLLHAKNATTDTLESRWIKELHIESLRMTRLVKELLDVNRIKQGQFAFVFSEVLMQDVIHKVIEQYRQTNPERIIEFENKIKDDKTMVVGDFDKLVEMASGLLGNAIKFSKPQDKILISLKGTSDSVSVTVKDHGKGISKKDLDAVFDEFYKSDNASHIEGMGVGLLLAKYIIENHRGKIKITSKENKGTKVEIILPAFKTEEF